MNSDRRIVVSAEGEDARKNQTVLTNRARHVAPPLLARTISAYEPDEERFSTLIEFSAPGTISLLHIEVRADSIQGVEINRRTGGVLQKVTPGQGKGFCFARIPEFEGKWVVEIRTAGEDAIHVICRILA